MISQYCKLLQTFQCQPNDELSTYFSAHAEQIDTLIQLYNEYNHRILTLQEARLSKIKAEIEHITNDRQWQNNEGLELEYHYPYPSISIEAGFESANGDPFAKFNIYITTPSIQSWNHYEDKLLSTYPDKDPQIADNKTLLLINSIPGHENEPILKVLRSAYAFLSSLTFIKISYPLTSH